VRPKLDQVLVLAAVVGIAVGVVVLLSASAAPLGLGAVACGCSLLAFASLGVLAVAASWLVQSSRRATGLVLRASR
jgi:succinate-acetate transporter protein